MPLFTILVIKEEIILKLYRNLLTKIRPVKYVRGILIVINIICVLGLLGSYCSYILNPFDYWYISLLGLGYFIWCMLNVAFIIIWLFIKWKYSLVSLAALVLGFTFHTKMIAFNFPGETKTNKETIKVISYNIELFKFYDWKKNEAKRDKILNFISNTEADIYCFQEYFQTRDEEFITTEKLKQILPEHFMHFEAGVIKFDNQEYGLAIFSTFPIVNKGHIIIDSTKDRTNLVIYTDVLIKTDTIRIYNVHLASNHLNPNEVNSVINTHKKPFTYAKRWLKKLKSGYKRRYHQVNLLSEHLASCKYPSIITGDFNDVPVSYTYRKMNKNYADAFIESGSGIGATYNGNLPMLRIDYIFHSTYFGCNRFKVYQYPVTDHYPIMAELYIRTQK